MASNSRDEILKFIFQTEGEQGLRDIAVRLDEIAKSASDSAPQAQALLDQLAKLAGQSGAIDGLIELKAKLGETDEKLQAAKDGLAALNAEFAASDNSSSKVAASFAKAEQAVAELSARHNALTAQVTSSTNSLRAAGIDTDHLDSAQRNLSASMATVTSGAASLGAAHKAAAGAQEAETVTVSDLAERYGILGRAIENIKTIFATVGAFVGLEKAKEEIGDILAAGDKFETFGIKFAAAFGGAEAGQAALEKVKELADQTPLSMDAVADAAIRARKEGLDPFDGTLKALIETNLKYGGSAQDLTGLIDTLGHAYAKGSLGSRELTSLQQQGIPVVELLANALGKTGDQILEMSKKGQLGKESIATLIDEFAKSSGGAASASMDLLSTQVTKLHDDWEDFLQLIADAGVYDFAKEELRQIGDSIKTGLGDGSLKEKAQAISDAIVGIGKAAIGAAQFLSEHAGAIKTVAEAYALFKASQLVLDLAQMANGLRASTAAALENAAAAQADAAAQARLTAAMEAATVAAGAQASAVGASEVALSAASKGGILQALASFGSLRGALNGIGTAITGLVGGPIVALVASIGFVAVEAVKLVSNLKDWHDITEKLAAQQKELAAAQDVLVEKAKQVAAQTKASADVQIASAQQLSAMSKRQSEDYVEQLQNAVRYYTAMRVQAQASGDSAGVQMATAHLRDLVVALGDAKESSEKATESLGKISDRAAAVADRFDALRTKGESAATSVAGAFSNIEIATPKGLQDVLDIVAQVSIRSADAKTAVQTELAGALQKLNEQDLADFQRNINDRLKEAKGNAQDLSTALSASLEASLLKLGISAQQAGIQISEADQKIVTSFKSIAENAKATGEQVQLAFANALSKLETTGAVDALKRSLQEAFDSGRISAAQFESGMDAAGRKLADVQVAAAQASSNLDGMGVAGQTAAQRISSSLQDTRDRLVVQASQIVAAIAAGLQHGDDVAALRAQYRALDAQIQALNDDINKLPAGFDAAGNSGAKSGDRIAESFAHAAHQADQMGESLAGAGGQADQMGKSMDGAGDGMQNLSDDAKNAKQQIKDLTEGDGGYHDLVTALANTRQGFLQVSDAAAKAFDAKLLSDWNLAFDSTGANIGKTLAALNNATLQTNKELAADREQLDGMIANWNSLGTAAGANFEKLSHGAESARKSAEELVEQIKSGNFQLGILGQADLSRLEAAADAAAQRMRALADAEKNAVDQLQSLNDQLADQIDQITGNATDQENRRYQNQLAQIKQLAEQAGTLGTAAYQQAVQQANQLHELKMKQIQQEQQAQSGSGASGAGSGAGAGAGTNSGGGIGSSPTSSGASSSGAVSGFGGVPMSISHDARTVNIVLANSQQADDLTGLLQAVALQRNNSIYK